MADLIIAKIIRNGEHCGYRLIDVQTMKVKDWSKQTVLDGMTVTKDTIAIAGILEAQVKYKGNKLGVYCNFEHEAYGGEYTEFPEIIEKEDGTSEIADGYENVVFELFANSLANGVMLAVLCNALGETKVVIRNKLVAQSGKGRVMVWNWPIKQYLSQGRMVINRDIWDYVANKEAKEISKRSKLLGMPQLGMVDDIIYGGATVLGSIEDCNNNFSTINGEVRIPDCVTSIYDNAFIYEGGIDSIILGKNVKSVGSNAFSVVGHVHIRLNEGLERIGSEAFDNTIMTHITIPSTVKLINANAFENSLAEEIEVESGALKETYASIGWITRLPIEGRAGLIYCKRLILAEDVAVKIIRYFYTALGMGKLPDTSKLNMGVPLADLPFGMEMSLGKRDKILTRFKEIGEIYKQQQCEKLVTPIPEAEEYIRLMTYGDGYGVGKVIIKITE